MQETEESLREMWDVIKCNNIYVVGVPERGEKGTEYLKY